MKEAYGNLWEYPADVRVITTNGYVKNNGEAVMGRGCAKEAAVKYPELAGRLGMQISLKGNIPHKFGELWTFPVKHNWWEKADIDLIQQSAGILAVEIDESVQNGIVMPRPGCGNGGLAWSYVKPFIRDILDDRFTVITFA